MPCKSPAVVARHCAWVNPLKASAASAAMFPPYANATMLLTSQFSSASKNSLKSVPRITTAYVFGAPVRLAIYARFARCRSLLMPTQMTDQSLVVRTCLRPNVGLLFKSFWTRCSCAASGSPSSVASSVYASAASVSITCSSE